MYEWNKQIQSIIDAIDDCIKKMNDEELTLHSLSCKLGYSEFYVTRKFKELSGMHFRTYLRQRKLAFALKEIRDTDESILKIALNYGFSSHEAFTRAFKSTYGCTPTEYRKNPRPLILRTKITLFDRYLLGLDEIGMMKSDKDIKIYLVTIPAHKYLHIKNYESNGYWDFWKKQNAIAGQDYETICGYLDSIKGKLDDYGGSENNSGSGQIMAYINDPNGRICDWGIFRTECYGARLPSDYKGELPSFMSIADIEENEYVVFEHGPFNYEQENRSVEYKLEEAMASFERNNEHFCYDTRPGRIIYLYYDPQSCIKYVRPIRKT